MFKINDNKITASKSSILDMKFIDDIYIKFSHVIKYKLRNNGLLRGMADLSSLPLLQN